MIRKLLIITAVASVVSANAFALDIKNGKLLSHKEWATSTNIKFSFKDSNKKQMLPNILANKKISDNMPEDTDVAIAQNRFEDVVGLTNQSMTISGESWVTLQNESNKQQNYTVQTYLCIYNFNDVICAISKDELELYPKGSVSISKVPQIETTFKDSGGHPAYVYNVIYRDGSPVFLGVADGTINILEQLPQRK
jgi:hypothetical protein